MSIGILLSDDLLFNSRITGTASSLNLTIKVCRDSTAIATLAKEQGATGVILDLAFPGLDVPKCIASLRETCSPIPRVVTYGSHVEVDTLKAAREAGCDLVLPRSAFVEKFARPILNNGSLCPSGINESYSSTSRINSIDSTSSSISNARSTNGIAWGRRLSSLK